MEEDLMFYLLSNNWGYDPVMDEYIIPNCAVRLTLPIWRAYRLQKRLDPKSWDRFLESNWAPPEAILFGDIGRYYQKGTV